MWVSPNKMWVSHPPPPKKKYKKTGVLKSVGGSKTRVTPQNDTTEPLGSRNLCLNRIRATSLGVSQAAVDAQNPFRTSGTGRHPSFYSETNHSPAVLSHRETPQSHTQEKPWKWIKRGDAHRVRGPFSISLKPALFQRVQWLVLSMSQNEEARIVQTRAMVGGYVSN